MADFTKEQTLAITTLDRNVSVSAGAGSGKTRVLVERFLTILKDPDKSANRILAITFTRKAAREMRERIRKSLLEEVGKTSGELRAHFEEQLRHLDGAPITTIDGFCSQILRDHPVEAGMDPQFTVKEEYEVKEFQASVIDAFLRDLLKKEDEDLELLLGLYHPGRLGSMLYGLLEILPDLMALGDLSSPYVVRQEDWEEAKIRAEETFLAMLASGADLKPSKTKDALLELENARAIYHEALVADDLETVLPFMNLIRAAGKAAPLIKEWKEALIKLQGYARNEVAIPYAKAWNGLLHRLADRLEEESLRQEIFSFSFLAGRAVSLLRNYPEICRAYQHRFDYIMVDEFQDTNEQQKELVYLLSGATASELRGKNLFIVGDAKQSIYRFRGADVTVFRVVRDDIIHSGGTDIVMADNFRSAPEIIESCNCLFRDLLGTDPQKAVMAQDLVPHQKATQKPILAIIDQDDYAKWTTDGDVIILGRTDNQVKLRGLRIELGEIEKCLTAVDGIKSGIALIRKVGKADAICVYYTADRQLDPDEIKSELAKTLTDYMVPSAYVQLDKMPLTPNGKVNTKVLPEPKSNKSESGRLPKNEIEKTFCDIFAEILELDNVFADDNFFDLGGTSLTATRIVISASKKNIEVAYSDIFTNPTPQTLAKFVSKDDSVEDDLENLSDYDYTNINKVLEKNNIDTFKNGELQKLGNVLLTGSAGFLGVHILYELLHKYNGKVYCMIRDKNNNPAENRMNSIYYYYFEESLKERYPDRVTVISGDVTNRESFDKFIDKDINTVINCAANVKHFSKGTDIEDVNLYGTLNVLDFCKKANARLVHVSTMSVGGMFVGEQGSVDKLKENQLYFGQHEGSKYTLSKFLAERAILEEVSKGFNAKIMRVGTLAARNSDGEYQINFTTNTFMGRLKSTLLIGKYPYEAMEMPFELSPIDFVAKAILLLAQAPKDCTVFHPFNNHTLIMGDLYTEMNKIGLHSQGAEYEEYMIALDRAEQDPEKAKILSSMIAYQNMAHGQKTFTVGKSNTYTMQVLYRMGFVWPVTSLDYMKRFINALRGLGFFD